MRAAKQKADAIRRNSRTGSTKRGARVCPPTRRRRTAENPYGGDIGSLEYAQLPPVARQAVFGASREVMRRPLEGREATQMALVRAYVDTLHLDQSTLTKPLRSNPEVAEFLDGLSSAALRFAHELLD